MTTELSSELSVGPYQGALLNDFRNEALTQALADLPALLSSSGKTLSDRDDQVAHLSLPCNGGGVEAAIKSFGTRSAIKDKSDRRSGSRAERSWRTATTLRERHIGTPKPICYLDRWESGRLVESYYLSAYDTSLTSFRHELIRIYREAPLCSTLIALIEFVADEIWKMHQAGIVHGDMGNQNILLRRDGEAKWTDLQFIDLNRAYLREGGCTLRDAALDLSRIHLPSDFRRILYEMYFSKPPPPSFEKWEGYYRGLLTFRSRTRKLRHPVRSRKREKTVDLASTYPPVKDIWIWDDRSAQAISTLRRKDRKRMYPVQNHIDVVNATARALLPVRQNYRELLDECYTKPVSMSGRVGMAIDPRPGHEDKELELLRGLGTIPVMARFYHHEDEAKWEFTAKLLHQLKGEGHEVAIALVQDRNAVRRPHAWADFMRKVLDRVHDVAKSVEIGHAINRVKWGVWTFGEYQELLRAYAEQREKYPGIEWTGPAAIDFEYYQLLAALDRIPRSMPFHALSHHLYVDRRGAPENKQGPFDSTAKFALARAIARWSPSCADRLVISEVNWPLKDTGIYSPIGSPYLYPGQKVNGASVSESVYADYMIRYLLMALCSGMVDRVYWWRLVAHGFGLVDDRDPAAWRPRPAYDALKVFFELLGDTTFRGKLPSPGGTFVYHFEKPDGQHMAIAYAWPDDTGLKDSFGAEYLADRLGQRFEMPAGGLRLTGQPVYLGGISL